jgi:hypothetical protein
MQTKLSDGPNCKKAAFRIGFFVQKYSSNKVMITGITNDHDFFIFFVKTNQISECLIHSMILEEKL